MCLGFANSSKYGKVMVFVSSLKLFYKMRFLYIVFIMLYTEDFSMRHYVGFSQIGSHIVDEL